jgi:hypothetical protein
MKKLEQIQYQNMAALNKNETFSSSTETLVSDQFTEKVDKGKIEDQITTTNQEYQFSISSLRKIFLVVETDEADDENHNNSSCISESINFSSTTIESTTPKSSTIKGYSDSIKLKSVVEAIDSVKLRQVNLPVRNYNFEDYFSSTTINSGYYYYFFLQNFLALNVHFTF